MDGVIFIQTFYLFVLQACVGLQLAGFSQFCGSQFLGSHLLRSQFLGSQSLISQVFMDSVLAFFFAFFLPPPFEAYEAVDNKATASIATRNFFMLFVLIK